MSDRSTILSLPLIQASQAQKHVTHNEAIRRLDALVQPVAQDLNRTVPPALPADGDRHIVAAGAGGDWAGKDGTIAVREDAAWAFVDPSEGWRIHVVALGADVVYRNGAWSVPPVRADLLGINAEADATNRLTVSADATLLTHAGAGHQLKLDKADAGETASLLFQTGFSGRAEMGCAGEDAFSVKVSADGASWTTALRVDPVRGSVAGAAVQADAADTDGKLALTDWTFGRGNALGPVALAAGQPTGGLIESGSTGSGHFVKFADGTMICHHRLTMEYASISELRGDWTYPAAFVAAPQIQATADRGGINISADLRRLGATLCDQVTATGARVEQIRAFGGTDNFAPGNTMAIHVTAFGRWA